MKGFKMTGKCFCICEDLRELAKKFPKWTVSQLISYIAVVEAERRQFEGARI